ncbi:peptidase M18 [Pseudoalteromonas denitrificans]|uniref:M18 family aminopeptidase n=1 Tax=Pseudoalteromonas denitrificans DSM 6059 TaxID=1123010 RepID=A0A1I1QCE6_9GAMM|nr:peptidase M18 [Pseudoalteromonas denitrificans]SFD19824.1 Aspartyl aminopeptidase [Pseudoalteromonas denitrificans DSM 6059]
MRKKFLLAATIITSLTIPSVIAKEEIKNSWLALSKSELKQVQSYNEEYKSFIDQARTELTFVSETKKLVEQSGFNELTENSQIVPGAKLYSINRDRAMTLMVIGSKPVKEGVRIAGAHIDSPRIELKGRPLYEKNGFALFQTYTHGGMKNYQWVNIPLALIGRVDKKDGTHVDINIGLNENDPILIIPDLAPHVDRDYRKRTNRDVIKKEELDIIIASKPGNDSTVKQEVINFLKTNYDISIADLVSAELALVPAVKPRDVGLDRSMVAAYGHDDKISSFAAVKSILEVKKPEYTAITFLVDNEEVGNLNNTGADSSYLVDTISQLLYQQSPSTYNDYLLRKTLRKTKVISVDVNPGVNPNWPGVWELGNAPKLGEGINIKLYGGGFNANSEYIAWTRNYLDNADILWQTSTYKGKASGGTIGSALSENNMDVIDFGVPVLGMHSPYAVASKVDIYAMYTAMKAFFVNK